MVVDWRARISLAFYRASKTEPMGVELRRRFGFQHGEMTAYEDEALRLRRRRSSEHSRDPRGRDRAAARRPDARHRRHHPARAGRHRPLRPRASRSACRARPAPARPRSGCTARRTCSTRTATSSPGRACWWSGRTRRSCATSATCCRRSARSTRSRPRSRSWSARRWPGSTRSTPSAAPTRPPSPRSRATPGWRRSCTGRCGRRCGRPPRACWCRAGARRWRLAPYEVEEIARRAARPRASGTAPPAGCSRSGSRTGSW